MKRKHVALEKKKSHCIGEKKVISINLICCYLSTTFCLYDERLISNSY